VSQREEALHRTEQEILAEKAATLGRAGERLEAALRLVTERRLALDRASGGVAREAALASYRQARARALEARRTLIIQREAIGLRSHRIVDQQFPEPPVLG
jgi:hypothetical protein